MKTIGDRIKERRKVLGLTQAQVAKQLGVSHVSLSQWERGDTRPSGENLHSLAKNLGVSVEWLLYGENEEGNVEPADIGGTRVPLISYVQAGMWRIENEGQLTGMGGGVEYIFTDLPLSKTSFALRIRGDSMEPEFREGDRIIIDPEVSPGPGDYVVAMNGTGEVTFKKYRARGTIDGEDAFELIPLNEDYPTLSSRHHEIMLLGTMVEHRRYRKAKN